MTAAISSFPPVLDASRTELGRLCRKICIERERDGQPVHSSEAEFYEALATVRSRFGSESVTEEELWEIVRVEEKRVADGAVLAELLLPRLLTALRTKAPPTISPIALDSPLPPLAEPRVATPAAPPGIADLLEGMLDQQRTEARNRSSSHRS